MKDKDEWVINPVNTIKYCKRTDITFVDQWEKENSDLNEARQRCLHRSCTKCNGTGQTKTGEACIHMISCPCPKCSPYYL